MQTTPPLTLILTHTPTWVWGLLAALVLLGLRQATPRVMSPGRIWLPAIGLGIFSLMSATRTFMPAGGGAALLCWLLGAAAGVAVARPLLRTVQARALDARRYEVAGSLLPLALMLGIFLMSYVLAVVVAIQPALAATAAFAWPACIACGLPAGILAARSLRIWTLTAAARRLAPAQGQAA